MIEVTPIPALSDNYAYLLKDTATDTTAVIDPSEAKPVEEKLDELGCELHFILNTHHHFDHVGGNLELKEKTGARIIGHEKDKHRIPGLDEGVNPGETISIGEEKAQILSATGHTTGHILFWFENSKALFSGDTLFSIGCGRLFEGTAGQMWETLKTLRSLPSDTKMYFGHEYTQANIRFALGLEPGNKELLAYRDKVNSQLDGGSYSTPSLLSDEMKLNPFLRADDPKLKSAINLPNSTDEEVFAQVRKLKDNF